MLRDAVTDESGPIDLAVVGAGVAGTYVAYRAARLHSDWAVTIFERTDRVGGRLFTRPIGLDGWHIELGGMRFRPGHVHAAALVEELGLAARPFATGHPENRLFLRGRHSRMADGAPPGAYALDPSERDVGLDGLILRAFNAAVPGATDLGEADWVRVKRDGTYGDRPLREWRIDEVYRASLSEDAAQLILDALGYMSGIGPQNAADAIPYLLQEATPIDEQLTLVDGMDALPRTMAERFETGGGRMMLGHELAGFDDLGGRVELQFADGTRMLASRLVLALPRPAMERVATRAAFLRRPDVRSLVESTIPYKALKLYLWYDRPWWRDEGFAGHRINSDLPLRKTFYLDKVEATDGRGPSLLLAAYGDGTDLDAWRTLSAAADATRAGSHAAPEQLLEETQSYLRQLHGVDELPGPVGSAMRLWGADPHMTGWHYWAVGANSTDVKARIPQPDPAVPVYICGEAWSTAQAWIEGALESANAVVDRLT